MKLWKKDPFWRGSHRVTRKGKERPTRLHLRQIRFILKRTGDSLLRCLSLKASKPETVRSGSLTTTANNPEIYRKTSQHPCMMLLQSYLFPWSCPLPSFPASLGSGHLKVMRMGSLQESASLLSTQGLCSCLSWCYFKSVLFYCIPLRGRGCLVLLRVVAHCPLGPESPDRTSPG